MSDSCTGAKQYKHVDTSCMDKLTPAEMSVMRRIIERKSNQEIADELGVTVNTVKFHKKNIYVKWGVRGVRRRIEVIALFNKRMSPTAATANYS